MFKTLIKKIKDFRYLMFLKRQIKAGDKRREEYANKAIRAGESGDHYGNIFWSNMALDEIKGLRTLYELKIMVEND